MAQVVCSGAVLRCSFGAAPATLDVTPPLGVSAKTPVATVADNVPMVNVPTFGQCTSLANPEVAAATAAALGVLTPMPCVPVPAGPWVPGVPTVTVANIPAIDMDCKLMCAFGGVITITSPG